MKRYLESQPSFPKTKHGEVTVQRVKDLLTQILYAGYIEHEPWDVSLRPAQHEGLIDYETFLAIQDLMAGKARVPARKDLSDDFPLRGFILCGCCNKPLTANWSKGKAKRYFYYLCRQKGCEMNGKSIRAELVESEFEAVLKRLQPTEEYFAVASSIFKELWDQRAATMKKQAQTMKAELSQIDRKTAQLMDRLIEADSDGVIRAYENHIGKLESERALINEKIAKCGRPLQTYEDTFEHALEFLASPWNIWENGGIEHRQTVLKLGFADQLAYDRDNGFRTPKLSLPFKTLACICMGNKDMARRGGFEPPTPRFVVWCSIQLSYRRLSLGG